MTCRASSSRSNNFKIDSHTATSSTRPRQLSTVSTASSSNSNGNCNNNHPPSQLPLGTQVLFQSDPLSVYDEALVIGFSLIVFSSVIWVPWAILKLICKYYWRERNECRTSDDEEENKYQKRKKVLRNTILLALTIAVMKPYANASVGRWLNVRRWRIWKAWLNYVGMEVLLSRSTDRDGDDHDVRSGYCRTTTFDWKNDPAIFAIIPHGLFPFPLAFAALTDAIFGIIRPVAATATSLFPFVRELLGFLDHM